MKREELDLLESLLSRSVITDDEAQQITESARSRKRSLRQTISDLRIMSTEDFEHARADYFGVPYMQLRNFFADTQALALVTESFAKRELVFPLFVAENHLAVAVADPTNLVTIDKLRDDSGMDVVLYLSPEHEIQQAITRNYSDQLVKASVGEDSEHEGFDVPRLVDSFIHGALGVGASDLHIEPGRDNMLIRQRVDGVLQEIHSLPASLQNNVISRFKIMAGLDISETRAPQDGHISMVVSGEEVSLRISTLPTLHGENVVVRILVSSKARIGLDSLGMEPATLARLRKAIHRPHGMIVVTGPTGSGKTTTLYSILDVLNTVCKNIMTIEDPVEYTIDLLRQTQVNPKAGLTFSTGLRSILRQDPDIVMVGEIRDGETARVAVQAALTGHLVLSTLHTNDASSAITRLIQMGVQPFLVASSLIGVVGQRLVRKACDHCREPMHPDPAHTAIIPDENMDWFEPTGCDSCRNTGYKGRTGVYEVLQINAAMQAQIARRAAASTFQRLAIESGMSTMFEDGVRKVREGVTTLAEVYAVTEAAVPDDVPVESDA